MNGRKIVQAPKRSLVVGIILALLLTALSVVISVPGEGLQSNFLRGDTEKLLLEMDAAAAPDCPTRAIVRSELVHPPEPIAASGETEASGSWQERWYVNRCGNVVAWDVRYRPSDRFGTVLSVALAALDARNPAEPSGGNTSMLGAAEQDRTSSAVAAAMSAGSVFLVTNVNDAGPGSLSQAITDANASPNRDGPDLILFKIPDSGPHSITLMSALPPITDPLIIDGYSQPGSEPNSLPDRSNAVLNVGLDGSKLSRPANGLILRAGSSTVRGLRIEGFAGDGIRIEGSGSNRIEGNSIGGVLEGERGDSNGGSGVVITDSPNNVIGGSLPAARNVISGNGDLGVRISGSTSIGNALLGNSIAGNIRQGIELDSDAPETGREQGVGANQGQQPPALKSVTFSPPGKDRQAEFIIEGLLEGIPFSSYRIELFATHAHIPDSATGRTQQQPEPVAVSEGERLLASMDLITGEDGQVGFQFHLPRGIHSRDRVTATATDSYGNTSEFSPPLSAPAVTFTWIAGSGNWGAPDNWSPSEVPGLEDDVVIAANGSNSSFTVTVDVAAAANSLTLGGGIGTQTLSLPSQTLTLNDTSTVNSDGALSLSGGTLSGFGNITINGSLVWTAGTMAGAGVTTANGGMTIDTGFFKDINGARTLNASGTITWTSGAIRMGNGAVINNAGIWNSQSDTSISNAFGGNATFVNSGTFKKTGSSGTTSVSVPFNNAGTVLAQMGTISLGSNGTHTGAFSGAGGVIQFSGGAHELNAGTSLTGITQVTGATLDVNSALTGENFSLPSGTVNVNSPFSVQTCTQTGGTLQGAATFTATGLYAWTAGTMAGTGVTAANGGMSIDTGSFKDINGARALNTSGTITWTSGAIRMGSGAVINNAGIWNAQSDTSISSAFGGNATFVNSGTFKKTGSTGTTSVSVPFNNAGTVLAQMGTISLGSNGTHTGAFSGSGGVVQFSGGTHELNAGTSLTGPTQVAGATLDVNSALTAENFSLSSGTVNVNSPLSVQTCTQTGGTLQGAATFTAAGLYAWTAGTMAGAGVTAANGGMSIDTGSFKDINGARALNTAGAITWTSGAIRMGNGAVINNAGIWNAQSDTSISNAFGGNATFVNSGTFTKTGSTGTTSVSVPFNNAGTVLAQMGTISLGGDGTHTGAFSGSGGVVQFSGGTHELNEGTSLTGPTQVTGATLHVNSALTGENLSLSSGTVNVNSPFSVQTCTQSGGTLQGAATFTATGLYAWTAGTMAGTGVTAANGGMSIDTGSFKDINGARALNASGTITWTSGAIRMGSGAVINNAGIWNAQSDTSISSAFGGNATFVNSGTFKKTGSTGTTSVNVPFNNAGTVLAQMGTISLGSNGTHAGAFSGSGGVVQFSGGTHELNAGTSLTGPTQVTGATLDVNSALTAENFSLSSGTVNVNHPFSVQTCTQTGGTLQGAATFTATGLYAWAAGTMAGAGVTAANGGMSIDTGSFKDINGARALNTSGTITWTNGAIQMGNGAVINNAGIWNSQNDTTIFNGFGGNSTFVNSGTFKKTGSTGTTSVSVPFSNAGTVLAQMGTISLGSSGTHTGAFSGSGGVVQFSGGTHELNAGTSLTGPTQVTGATLDINSALTGENFSLSSGTVNVNSPFSVQTCTQTGGTLQGAATFTATGLYAWTAGTMGGAGVTAANGGMSIDTGSFKDINGARALNTSGTITWTSGAIRMGNGAVINNAGIWNSQSDTSIFNGFGGNMTFVNSGTFKKTGSTGTTSVSVPFTNTGLVEVQLGTINVSGSNYTQTAGITKLTGGSLYSTTSMNIQGGALGGSGTITGPVIVSGTGALAPGLSPGTLSLVGSYTQLAPGGAFNVEIGGTTPGSQFDRADVSGPGSIATLAGLLNVSLINSFTPAPGDSFTIMTYPSHTGTFTPNLFAAGCVGWQVNYGATALVLTAVQVPAEVTGLMFLADQAGLVWNPPPAYPGTVYDVLRGNLSNLPVDSGPDEFCLQQGITNPSTTDPLEPAINKGFWYLVRERVAGCGVGTYGHASSGAERTSTVCP